jgi:hypothetical protein
MPATRAAKCPLTWHQGAAVDQPPLARMLRAVVREALLRSLALRRVGQGRVGLAACRRLGEPAGQRWVARREMWLQTPRLMRRRRAVQGLTPVRLWTSRVVGLPEPAGGAHRAGQVQRAEQVQPAEQVRRVEQARRAEPVQRVEPARPGERVQPVAPVQRVEPARPGEPVQPGEQAQPAERVGLLRVERVELQRTLGSRR